MPEDNSSPEHQAKAAERQHSEAKSEIAQNRPRDEDGHFIPQEKIEKQQKKNTFERIFSENVHYDKGKDDVLDVHVGNPLRRITQLLEEIKKQKAFSFTLKGSLGIAGVLLAISFLGILGAGNVLCTKGVQTEVGTLSVLNAKQEAPSQIPILGTIFNWFNNIPNIPNFSNTPNLPNRTILVRQDGVAILIPYSQNVKLASYANMPVAATGQYDACSQTLKVNSQSNIEVYTNGGK